MDNFLHNTHYSIENYSTSVYSDFLGLLNRFYNRKFYNFFGGHPKKITVKKTLKMCFIRKTLRTCFSRYFDDPTTIARDLQQQLYDRRSIEDKIINDKLVN